MSANRSVIVKKTTTTFSKTPTPPLTPIPEKSDLSVMIEKYNGNRDKDVVVSYSYEEVTKEVDTPSPRYSVTKEITREITKEVTRS